MCEQARIVRAKSQELRFRQALDMDAYHNDTGCIDFPEEAWKMRNKGER